MTKGGYKIINFQDVNLVTTSEDGVTISGIHDAIENTYRKPLLISGLTIDGVEKADTYATATASDNTFTISAYGHTITVTDTNLVTITA